MKTNLKRIYYFIKIAERLGYHAAAEVLFVTPQALHKEITKLEKELGQSLFTRAGRGLELTDFGREYYKLWSETFEQIGIAEQKTEMLLANKRQKIKMGFFRALPKEEIVTPVADQLRALNPRADIRFFGAGFDEVIELLASGKIDLALTNKHDQEDMSAFCSVSLYQAPAKVVVSLRHPWVIKESISAQDMSEEPMLFLRQESQMNPVGFYRTVQVKERIHCEDFDALLEGLENGRCFAVFPCVFDSMQRSHLMYFDLPEPYSLTYETVCMYMPENRFAAQFEALKDLDLRIERV